MDFKTLLEDGREILAVLGLILIALIHPSESTVSGVVGALAGIIVGKKL